jgi:HD superfamily phosphodiesterase
MENTESYDYDILIASALLHDIGIKQSGRLPNQAIQPIRYTRLI